VQQARWDRRRPWLERLGVGVSALGVVVLSSATAFAGTAGATPVPAGNPGASGTASQWKTWSADQAAAARAYPWATALSGSGCSVKSVSYQNVPSPGAAIGIPKGVDFTAVTVVTSCGSIAEAKSPDATTASTGPSPLFTSPYYQCGGITDGGACVGLQAEPGSVYDLEASYTYAGSASTYGHVELGSVGTGSCGPGTTVANGSPEVTLSYAETQAVYTPWLVSSTWSSTWWQDNGGGNYADFGSVCSSY
jgi:hypothetical protein